MVKRIKIKEKPPFEAKQIFKTIRGKRQRYVSVNIRSQGRTINKQYRYRGGSFKTYLEEAKLPQGTKYYVNYSKGNIIRNQDEITALVKQVKERKKAEGKRKKRTTKAKALKELRLTPKRVLIPPAPIDAEKVIDAIRKKIDYEKEHKITDFLTKSQEDIFLRNLLRTGTRTVREADLLAKNFEKIKLMMSYAVSIEGINSETKQTEEIATFSCNGKRPLEITEFLKKVGLVPGEQYIDVYQDILKPFKRELDANAVYFNKLQGRYRISNVRIVVKFYNNPQRQLV